ncbi:Zn(II)2Cys6 transcription factor [Aspergillus lucknowensis]|uniref:Zn(2)-C6 fungal-type domain-containing protein n=1 Tax=Aspergillus lucknowensis TaxID=176173 RepID=A0ABR4LCL9_9EURO
MLKRCGTCKDRRIVCDRGTPTCGQCARANRSCKGYGLRLSWPKANNVKRAVVGGPLRRSAAHHLSRVALVNVSEGDLRMHYYLAKSSEDEYRPRELHVAMPFRLVQLDDTEGQLLQYFERTASRSLTILGYDPRLVGEIIIRMALANDSPSSTAVRRSLLGLASLHRHGLQSYAIEFKVSAITALNAATRTNISSAEALQHVAAGMLLCSFEIHEASCTSEEWQWYIAGIKQVLNASALLEFRQDVVFGALTDWVYYHESLGWFSSMHWRPGRNALRTPCRSSKPGQAVSRVTPSIFNRLLSLLEEGCCLVSDKPDLTSPEALNSYRVALYALSWKLRTFLPETKTEMGVDTTLALFHAAILVYLNRRTRHALEPASETARRIQGAFQTFSTLESCERQFPLFILGCEARTDEARCVVLELIARTEKAASSRSLYIVRKLIEAVWVQDDLAAGGGVAVDYGEKMSAVISVPWILPTFV